MSSDHPLANTEASVARVAVQNHPLAAGAVTTPAVVGSPPRGQINNYQPTDAMAAVSVGAVVSPPPPPQTYPNANATSNRPTVSDTNVSPSSKSLETLADDFLSSKPPPVVLRPSPLPRGQVGIVRLRTLVERRAWGDVLKLASTLLQNDESSSSSRKKPPSSKHYSRVYSSLLFGGQDDTVAGTNDTEITPDVRQETIEILMLRCNALLKLRRYIDLSKEVEQWNFLKQNDVTAPSIEWIPWGMRKSEWSIEH
jgi:hypothetical protein